MYVLPIKCVELIVYVYLRAENLSPSACTAKCLSSCLIRARKRQLNPEAAAAPTCMLLCASLPADVDLFNYQTAPGVLSPSSVFFVLLYFIILAQRSKMVLRGMPDLNKSNEEDKRRAAAVILRDPLLFTQAPPICS